MSNGSPLAATILHDLAGHVTSINGLAEIVHMKPEEAGELMVMLSGEAKAAVQALKDLQTVQAIEADSLIEQPRECGLGEVLKEAGLPPTSDAPSVFVDPTIAGELLSRIVDLVDTSGPGERALPAISVDGDIVSLTIDAGAPERASELEEGRTSGRKSYRPLALADILLPRWGGGIDIGADERAHVRLELSAASAP